MRPRKIDLPEELPIGSSIKRLAASLVSAISPGASIAVAVAGEFFPDPASVEQARWRAEITDAVNTIVGDLYGAQVPRSSVAWQIAAIGWEVDALGNGYEQIDEEIVLARLPDLQIGNIKEGLFHLESEKWITCQESPNSKTGYPSFFCKAPLFAFLDPFLRNASPIDDAQNVARFLLSTDEGASSSEIDKHFGWENRRLYPALWFLGDCVVPHACEHGYYGTYPIGSVSMSGRARLDLRKFSEQRLGSTAL